MTSEPRRNAPVSSSGARGMNMHQKMEDARARRAEAMAIKQPANDDARVSNSKPVSKPQPAPDASPTVAQASEPEPTARTRSKPRSRALSEARFPEILMPEEAEKPQGADMRHPMTWGLLVLLFALLVGAIYVIQ